MRVFKHKVLPSLPPRLARLEELAQNLWWAWNHDALALFRRLDQDLWEETEHNPVRLLGEVSQERLEGAAREEGFLAQMDYVLDRFDRYMNRENPAGGAAAAPCVAYFAAEFGLTESLPIYSGGLAMLAGDHLKAASDLGLCIAGIGLLYRRGYFQQYLNEAGWQQEAYRDNDFHSLPLQAIDGADGRPLTIEVAYPDGPVRAQIWKAQVGRVALYLLDTDIEANRPEDRQITASLYGGDSEMRIRQELLLGIGGVRALEALGLQPDAYHMNEGHSAFLVLERIRLLMGRGSLSFDEAREAVAATSVFTSHTPVPAGIDVFAPGLMARYLGSCAERLGLSWGAFLALGQEAPSPDGGFSMAVLALRLSDHRNGVSRLHGRVARRMWRGLWPQVPEHEIPIAAVTNGVHLASWISHEMAELFERYLGPRWREDPVDPAVWAEVQHIPADELWRTHGLRRERLIAFVRRRLQEQLRRRGAPARDVALAEEVLVPGALTLGFGRRFATYKRAGLLLRDVERLHRLLADPERPVQLILAGKAHPRDDSGKQLIQQIVQLARQEAYRTRLVFVENYDITVARYLLQGVDVWLNTPRRPNEACGTSGMKALINGALNLSTMDGWWDEAYQAEVGWSLGQGEEYGDDGYQDEVESQALYEILEKEVVPLFYRRESDGLPRAWIARMKASLRLQGHRFNAQRMVCEYEAGYYQPAIDSGRRLLANGGAEARALAAWKRRLRERWSAVS
ncbi:MAG: alpha-glucan family phosphorylase, partial [Gemmatimonadota bacterium]